MKILFVGDDWLGSNARSLADGFAQAGHDVVVIDTTSITLPRRLSPPWIYAKARTQRAPWTTDSVHQNIDDAAAQFRPDMLFCYKSIHLDQDRLLGVPARLHVHYSADDVSNPYNTTRGYLADESRWDAIVTTKAHNVNELRQRGVANVIHVWSAYDPAWHNKCGARTDQRYTVGFIGARRPDRHEFIKDLANRYGPRMYLAGPGWRRDRELLTGPSTVQGPMYGQDLSIAIAAITANLVLLNSDNRDTHTCRSFEVPAAGGLFVGERTAEHAQILDDGSQSLLFSTADELNEILDRCASVPAEVAKIAAAGYRRITSGGHRYLDRANEIVSHVD